MTNPRPLVIFTNMYPFGNVENFLEEELQHLRRRFSKIVIVPNQIGEVSREVPPGVIVDTTFASQYHFTGFFQKSKRIFKALSSANFYKEIKKDPTLLYKPRHLKSLLYFVSQSEYYYQWLRQFLHCHPDYQDAIFYSYWLHVQALGISLTKERGYPSLKQISRAHSLEIYPEDYVPSYIPLREESLKPINHIYTISDHGKSRLLRDFGSQIQAITTCRLGVKDPGFDNPENLDQTLSLVSTAYCVPEKRIDLLIGAIKILADRNAYKKILWTHFGNGPLENKMIDLAKSALGNKVEWTFAGYAKPDQILNFYKTHPVDLFVNTSKTEGIPVAIMEAQSCGIPVLATDVGGVGEIVNDAVGKLVSKNTDAKEIADAIYRLTADKMALKSLRANAKENWRRHYNSSVNFEEFATKI